MSGYEKKDIDSDNLKILNENFMSPYLFQVSPNGDCEKIYREVILPKDTSKEKKNIRQLVFQKL